jgi:predicted  nucleic acid-binding Zn-ribbon protein
VREQLRALVALSAIDTKAKEIDERLRGIPAELEARRLAVQKLADLVTKQEGALAEAEALLSSQDKDIAARSESLSKAKSKGAKAKNAREAEAAERELEAVRRSIKDGEGERVKLKERIERTRSALDAPRGALEEQRAELAKAEGDAGPQLETLKLEREGVVAGRDVYLKQIDKDRARTYERLRPKLSPVVCEVAGETCGGCRMAVAPQRFLQIMKAKEILQCQHCMRFLYHPDLLKD